MDWLIAGGIVLLLIPVGVLAQRRGWIDLSGSAAGSDRRSGGSGVFGIGDEVFNPTRHEAQLELDRQSSLPISAPTPSDDDRMPPDLLLAGPRYAGRVTIDLSSR